MQRTPPPVRSEPSKAYSEEPSPSPQLFQQPFEENMNTGLDNVTIGRKKTGKEKIPVHEADAPSGSIAPSEPPLQLQDLYAMVMSLKEENRQLKAMVTTSSATVQPPSEPQVMPTQASRSTAVPGTPLIPSIEIQGPSSKQTRRSRSQRKKTLIRRPDHQGPSEDSPSLSGSDDPPNNQGSPHSRSRPNRSRSHSRASHNSQQDAYAPKPTNLTTKLSDGIEPKASLWQLLVIERLELYATSLKSETQRRAYVIDQTESEAQAHCHALYVRVPRLTALELVEQLAAIYRNPAEVDDARSQYEMWVMPNTTRHGNFLEWYRKFRLLATQAEITDDKVLFRDLERKISDFLSRAVAIPIKDCKTTEELANILTRVDQNEVSLRERNRYRVGREAPVATRKPTATTNPLQPSRSSNSSKFGTSTFPKPFPPRNTPPGYTGPAAPNNYSNFKRSSPSPSPGAARTSTPRIDNLNEIETVQEEAEEFEEYRDAEEDFSPEATAEAMQNARLEEEKRLKPNA